MSQGRKRHRPRSRLLIGFAAAVVGAAGVIAAVQFTPTQAHAATGTWVALGDSYASGTGSPPYDADAKGFAPPPGADGSNCQRASSAYAPFIFTDDNQGRWDKLVFAACRGAVTSDVITRQASALNTDVTTVTISIGGNDAGFATTMISCLTFTVACDAAIISAGRFINNTLPQRLTNTYEVIRNFAPNATVYVLTYPQLYEETPNCGVISLSLDVRRRLNNLARELQTVIEQAVSKAGSGFIPVDIDPPFRNHRICSASPAITDATSLGDAYHPNFQGHTLISSALAIEFGN